MRYPAPNHDPVFLIGLGLYFLNQLALKPHVSVGFLHNQMNDCLLIACALPPILWVHGLLGLRDVKCPPRIAEVVGHLVIWSVLIEWIGPRWMSWTTGDPLDVVAYWVGGAVALACWHRHQTRRWFDNRLRPSVVG